MELIDKTAVIAEIQRRIDLLKSNQNPEGPIFCFARETIIEEYKNILSFLDTLEVKEVDLEKEFDDYIEKQNAFTNNDNSEIKYYNGDSFNHVYDIYPIAKHFFELGAKTQTREPKKDCETECPNFDEAQGTPITK